MGESSVGTSRAETEMPYPAGVVCIAIALLTRERASDEREDVGRL